MKRFLTYTLSVLIGLACASCGMYSETVRIETLQPAKYPVDYADKTVAIFNVLHIDGEQTPPYVYASDSLKTALAALGMKQGLELSDLFKDEDIPVYNLDLFCNDGCPDLYDSTYLHSLSEQTGAALLIMVDSVSISKDTLMERRNNYVDYGDYYVGIINAAYKAQFRFYDVEAQRYLPVFRMNDTLSYERAAWDTVKVFEGIPEAQVDTLVSVALGQYFAKQTVPQWVSGRRFYFTRYSLTGESQRWGQAAYYADRQDWKQAIYFWGQILQQSKGERAACAAFNLALGSEMIGEYTLALEWLQMADKYYVLPETEGYRKRVQERIAERNLMERRLE